MRERQKRLEQETDFSTEELTDAPEADDGEPLSMYEYGEDWMKIARFNTTFKKPKDMTLTQFRAFRHLTTRCTVVGYGSYP